MPVRGCRRSAVARTPAGRGANLHQVLRVHTLFDGAATVELNEIKEEGGLYQAGDVTGEHGFGDAGLKTPHLVFRAGNGVSGPVRHDAEGANVAAGGIVKKPVLPNPLVR